MVGSGRVVVCDDHLARSLPFCQNPPLVFQSQSILKGMFLEEILYYPRSDSVALFFGVRDQLSLPLQKRYNDVNTFKQT